MPHQVWSFREAHSGVDLELGFLSYLTLGCFPTQLPHFDFLSVQ